MLEADILKQAPKVMTRNQREQFFEEGFLVLEGIIDDVWSTIGSYNLDRRSLHLNLEVGLVALDEKLGRDLREQFEKDIERCTEVTIANLDARGPWQKFLDWFWYQMRAQL